MEAHKKNLKIKNLGIQDYNKTWDSMLNKILSRSEIDEDEVWILEHKPVYTLGFNASEDDILNQKEIPIVRTDRGGKTTYHGPGQLMVYFLINLRRLKWGPKTFINELENIVIDLLNDYKIPCMRKKGLPGVYVEEDKIASIGIKIKRGYSYHGLSLNVDMDLKPFNDIQICGDKDMRVTQISEYQKLSLQEVASDLAVKINNRYSNITQP